MRTSEVWIVSAKPVLVKKTEKLLRPYAEELRALAPAEAEAALEEVASTAMPTMIVLDIGGDVDWGMAMVRRIKRTTAETATVVLTERFSREFGAKILSEGISYYFSHDFCKSEFMRLAKTLLKPARETHKGEVDRDL